MLLALVILGAVVGGARGGGTASPAPDAPRYLALGDSLAAGIQPDRPSDQGYAEAIWHQRAARIQDLVLVKLGRGGETGASLIHRDRPGPSQLERAEQVIRSRRTSLVTLDIGANEVERCHRGNGFDGGCVDRALVSLRQSLSEVIRRLRAAGRGHLPLVGINYYNSFLGSWVHGRAGRLLARRSVSVERRINATLDRVYGHTHVPIANVEDAFATDQLDRYVQLKPYGRIPLAVARVCRWTWSCSDKDDDHTNTAGYRVIAREVEKVLDRRR